MLTETYKAVSSQFSFARVHSYFINTAGLKHSQGQRFCHPKLFIILIYTCNEYHFLKFWPTDFEGWAHNIHIYHGGISSSEN